MKIKFSDFGRCLVCLMNPCDCKASEPMAEHQSWREEFRKKFGRFYVSQLGTIDIEGAESIASDDVEYFIESQIAAAEARCRLHAEARGRVEGLKLARSVVEKQQRSYLPKGMENEEVNIVSAPLIVIDREIDKLFSPTRSSSSQ